TDAKAKRSCPRFPETGRRGIQEVLGVSAEGSAARFRPGCSARCRERQSPRSRAGHSGVRAAEVKRTQRTKRKRSASESSERVADGTVVSLLPNATSHGRISPGPV